MDDKGEVVQGGGKAGLHIYIVVSPGCWGPIHIYQFQSPQKLYMEVGSSNRLDDLMLLSNLL
jgi:hypothetical protein